MKKMIANHTVMIQGKIFFLIAQNDNQTKSIFRRWKMMSIGQQNTSHHSTEPHMGPVPSKCEFRAQSAEFILASILFWHDDYLRLRYRRTVSVKTIQRFLSSKTTFSVHVSCKRIVRRFSKDKMKEGKKFFVTFVR